MTVDPSYGARMLGGVRVLDLSRFLSGPQTTLFLAGLGAEVIRIDDPRTGDPTFDAPPFLGAEGVSLERKTANDVGIAYLKRARGKKAITLNLKSNAGKAVFLDLVAKSDIVVENFRVGVTDRLGISYEALKERNPRIIHCAITGYGSTGPERHRKAFDLMVQAAAGLMSITGEPDGDPSKTGSPLTDGIAGTFALAAILGALYQRDRTGTGQFIDVSMTDCLVSLLFDEPFDCYNQLGLRHRQGNRITRFSPFNTYKTSDGSVAIGAGTEEDWKALVEIMASEEISANPNFMRRGWRVAHNDEVDAIVAGWSIQRSTAEILELLDARDVPCSEIRHISELRSWPQLVERRMFEPLVNPLDPEASGGVAAAFPIKFSGTTAELKPACAMREHNFDVLGGILGLDERYIRELEASGVI